MPWLIKRFGKLFGWLLTAGVPILILLALYFSLSSFFSKGAKTEAKLGRTQTEAAIESGSDAVETISNRQVVDKANDRIVQEASDDVKKQTSGGGVTRAGRNGLCRLPGNRGKPECLQPAAPGGVGERR